MKQHEAIQRAVEVMRRQHKSISTEQAYTRHAEALSVPSPLESIA